ncbi:AMP-binding protein [Acanthopleuribacter pedis]|uniref:AMP-binding protein n=1 Tax=Acanthopleuribacter pedis TaxID=442870 RepID=A0A8J7U601_9BACT|nr:AMP-binding protein [Acanthopleuribacter pedis]MBO1321013.1 AMP-binding protein [Acanthopleuribacter pedis]
MGLFEHRIETVLREGATMRPDSTALIDGDTHWTYAACAAAARQYARMLQHHDLGYGDRVALLLDKSRDTVAAFFGAWIAGGIVVPVNTELKQHQIDHILCDSGARLLVTTSRKLRQLDTAAFAGQVLCIDEPMEETLPALTAIPDQANPDDPAVILYTSGSTGKPKGILVSHRNLFAGARIVAGYLGLQPEDRILCVLPFNFDYGLNQMLSGFYTGARIVLHNGALPADICRALVDHRITVFAGVPPLWLQLMSRFSPLKQTALPDLRLITNSGGAFPQNLLAAYRETLPHCHIVLMYGLTEAFRSSYLPPEELAARPGSMGRAIPHTRLSVVDAAGDPCPADTPGELLHQGPTVALGYWNNARATAAVFRPDPMADTAGARAVYSGDVVRRDREGWFTFVARADQMLKVQGFRLSPEEVEEVAYASNLVTEVIVVPFYDAQQHCRLRLHVVPKEAATFQKAALAAYCRQHMPRYMVPHDIVLHQALPRTATGKIDRKQVSS